MIVIYCLMDINVINALVSIKAVVSWLCLGFITHASLQPAAHRSAPVHTHHQSGFIFLFMI